MRAGERKGAASWWATLCGADESLIQGSSARQSLAPPAESQRDDLAQHAQAVAQKINFAALSVVPAHGDFAHAETGAARQKEQLDVEGKTIHPRRFENRPAYFEPKRFEPALCVPERQTGRNAHEQIEHAPGVLASPRLMDPDELTVERARTEAKIDIFVHDRLDQLGSLA